MWVVTALWNKIIFFLFYAYQLCLFFHSGEDGSVAWIALLETGVPMYYDDNWICSREDCFPLCNGYKAAPLVKCSGNNIYNLVLEYQYLLVHRTSTIKLIEHFVITIHTHYP